MLLKLISTVYIPIFGDQILYITPQHQMISLFAELNFA